MTQGQVIYMGKESREVIWKNGGRDENCIIQRAALQDS